VRGVKELLEIVDRITRVHSQWNTKPIDDVKVRYFSEVSLANFLTEERLFELLLTEAWHTEVFKRAGPLLKFIIEQNSI
jgi:hypothetical protein